MKKIILLVSVVLFGCVGYAQAQTSEKKLSRQERKEAKRAMEQALFEEAKQAIENKSFTLEADQVIFKRGRTAFVSSNTNFVTVNGNKGSVQVAFNIPVSGPNGLGGVTVDGNVSGYKVTTDKKGNIRLAMNITGVGISAQVNISLAATMQQWIFFPIFIPTDLPYQALCCHWINQAYSKEGLIDRFFLNSASTEFFISTVTAATIGCLSHTTSYQ